MKRFLIIFSLLVFFAGIISCDSSSDPTSTTKLTARVTYTTSTGKAPEYVGTKKIYLYLYKSAPDNATVEPDYQTSTSTAITSGTEYTLSISDIDAGDYYAMVFFDGTDIDTDGAVEPDVYEAYEFYQGADMPGVTDPVTITSGVTTELTMSFDSTYELAAGSAFAIPTTGRVKVTLQYNGTLKTGVAGVDDGTGKLFVYLLSSLSANAPASCIYAGSTSNAVTNGTNYTLNVTGVPAGTYYVLFFYDYKAHNSREAGNTDRYELYNDSNCTANAGSITVTNGETITITGVSFDDGTSSSNILGSSAAYKTCP